MPPSLRMGTAEPVRMIPIWSRAEMRQQEVFFSVLAPEAALGFTSPRVHVQSKPRMTPGFGDPFEIDTSSLPGRGLEVLLPPIIVGPNNLSPCVRVA